MAFNLSGCENYRTCACDRNEFIIVDNYPKAP